MNRELLQHAAKATGGKYFDLNANFDLAQILGKSRGELAGPVAMVAAVQEVKLPFWSYIFSGYVLVAVGTHVLVLMNLLLLLILPMSLKLNALLSSKLKNLWLPPNNYE